MRILLTLCALLLPHTALADATIHPELAPLASLVGKTWRGEFTGSTPEKPAVDVSRWELALNGQAVRGLHSMNDGMYGGETIITWSSDQESLVFHYFTTEGFFTEGTMTLVGETFVSHELVSGNENGITEVKSVGTILPDGRMHLKSQYLQNGSWVDGHEITYVEDPTAEVRFKTVKVES